MTASVAELYELSVVDIVEGIAARRLAPLELVEALLERIDALEPSLLAWANIDRDGALAAARACETSLAGGAPPGALAGLPLGVKDIYYTAGQPTEAGSPILKGFVPEQDAGAVARLRQAGAIILGKTITTQFADGDPPATRNPWNPAHTPGGSSSGSAAAVAARMIPAALGTQTAGSVLRPAAYCGVVGLKPTFGRISRRNVLPFAWSLDTMGVLTRSVVDAATLLQALAGYDAEDSGSVNRPVDEYRVAAERPRAPRLGLVTDFVERSQPSVREHIGQAARRLERNGASLSEVRLPLDLDLVLACHHLVQASEAADLHAPWHTVSPEAYAPRVRAAYAEVGQLLPAAAYVRAQRWRGHLRRALAELMTDLDALLLPTASNTAPDPSTTGDTSFQAPITLLGLPAISLPSGLSDDGLPFAIQLVAPAWQEANLLSNARWCEDVLGPLPAPPI